jgi:3D (Asp-Asp-Asp) domain-containing protein
MNKILTFAKKSLPVLIKTIIAILLLAIVVIAGKQYIDNTRALTKVNYDIQVSNTFDQIKFNEYRDDMRDVKNLEEERYEKHIQTSESSLIASYWDRAKKENIQIINEIKATADIANYWHISSYYTPVEGQTSYYKGDYESNYSMNCSGDCLVTASGHRLIQSDKYQVVACDNNLYALGTRFEITLPEDHPEYSNKTWIVTCEDTGGAVENNHLDLWAGIGQVGQPHPWIGELSTRKATVEVL